MASVGWYQEDAVSLIRAGALALDHDYNTRQLRLLNEWGAQGVKEDESATNLSVLHASSREA